ncbi:hypothetical protein J6590_032342 [Homalodisca vitripennis]|nr:hypothetical protein J6590_032342 [Homalodisca vitripennis]
MKTPNQRIFMKFNHFINTFDNEVVPNFRLLLTRRGAGILFVQLDRQSADRSVTYRVMRSSRLAGGAVSLVLAIEEYV